MSNFGERRDGTYRIREGNVIPKPLDEVLAEHDVSWVDAEGRDYRVVTDEAEFETLMADFESRSASELVAYDTETTGLHINCMGKRKSSYEEFLRNYYETDGRNEYLCDRLTGLIFCVDEGNSYYFSVASLKYHNLFELDDEVMEDEKRLTDIRSRRKKIIDDCMAKYNVASPKTRGIDEDIWRYFRGLSHKINGAKPSEVEALYDSVDCDIVVMERLRDYFDSHLFIGHNVGFDWKVSFLYGIDVHFAHDTLQLAKHLGKSLDGAVSLKNLTHTYLGLPQLELDHFFDIKKDKEGYVNLAGYKKGKEPSFANFSYMDLDASRYYAPADGDMTLRLCHALLAEMKDRGLEKINTAYQIDVMAAQAVGYVEFYGHMLDIEGMRAVEIYRSFMTLQAEQTFWESIGLECDSEITALDGLGGLIEQSFAQTQGANQADSAVLDQLEQTLKDMTEAYVQAQKDRPKEDQIALGSATQVAALFFDRLGYELKPGMKRGVGKAPMRWLKGQRGDDPKGHLKGIYEYEAYQKAKSVVVKFCKAMPYFAYPNGLISPSFNSNGTDTGRMSCSKPNAQQYPEEVTRLIYPRKGFMMMDCDYSQIESRVITSLAHEEAMAEYFADPDMDYHTRMASMLFNVPYESVDKAKRKQSKSLNFGIPYGMGPKSLAEQLFDGRSDADCIETAIQRQAAYFRVQPGIKVLFDKAIAEGRNYAISTEFGRIRFLEPIADRKKRMTEQGNLDKFDEKGIKSQYERFSKNTKIQGTAADIFKLGLSRNFLFIRLYNLYGKICLFDLVHDEQCMEVNTEVLDAPSVVAMLASNMKIDVEGWCPLYAAATLGHDLHGAKKDEEVAIHPVELQRLVKQFGLHSPEYSPYREDGKNYVVPAGDPEAVLQWYKNMEIEFNKEYVCHKLIKMFGEDEQQLPSAYAKLLMTVGVCTKKREDGSKYIDVEMLAGMLGEYFKKDMPETPTLTDFIEKLKTTEDIMLGEASRSIVYITEEACQHLYEQGGYTAVFQFALQKINEGKPAEERTKERNRGLDEKEYLFAYIPMFEGALSKRILERLVEASEVEACYDLFEDICDYASALLNPGELVDVVDDEDEEEWDEETLSEFGEGATKGDVYVAMRAASKFGYNLQGYTLIVKMSLQERLEWFFEREELKEFTGTDANIWLIDDTECDDASGGSLYEVEDKYDLRACVAFVHWCRDGFPLSPWEEKSIMELTKDVSGGLRYLWYQLV